MSPSEIRVGLTFDLRDAYLEAGYSEIETAEFDRADTIESIEKALGELGYQVDRIGNVKQLAARLVAGHRWDLVFNVGHVVPHEVLGFADHNKNYFIGLAGKGGLVDHARQAPSERPAGCLRA